MNDMNEVLDFHRQTITDDELVEKLKKVSASLKTLDISETTITSLYFIKQVPLHNLEELNISYLNISDFRLLKQLKNLKVLYANNINIKNIDLSNNLKLKKLSLEYNLISDIKFLEKNQDLEFLALTGNNLLEDISPLKHLSKLNELYLQGTGIVRREQLEALEGKSFKTLLVDENLNSQASVLINPLYKNELFKPKLHDQISIEGLTYEREPEQLVSKVGLFKNNNEQKNIDESKTIKNEVPSSGRYIVISLDNIPEDQEGEIFQYLSEKGIQPKIVDSNVIPQAIRYQVVK